MNRQSKGISLKKINVTDRFLKREMELARTEVIPYQWEALNDNVEGAEPSFCMRNFKLAAKLGEKRRALGQESLPVWTTEEFNLVPEKGKPMEDRFYGFVFQDTDFSKWIEAVGYSLAAHPDPELEKLADHAIDIVCVAQYEDGYLDTFYIINDPSKRLTNLRDHHELYCFGHLTEGAVAYYEGTGKDKLLKAAMRFADYVEAHFGEEPEKCKGYPGHEIAEMALGRLYELTGEDRYLKLAAFFVNERGKKPYYFDKEHGIVRDPGEDNDDYYHQAHLPVREQKEAVGHAVRAVYLYTGMAIIAKYTNDESLKSACERLWDSMTNEKMYVTGGIGGTPEGEAFSYPFHLPNDRMYNESCAAIGLAFFARRMLEMSPKNKYADAMERAIYNTVLGGMALDGKSFFYVNPMEAYPEGIRHDAQLKHVVLPRQKWFGCACCPPNINRILNSVAQYAYSENEDTLFMHLYCGADIDTEFAGKKVKIQVTSAYPWEENVRIAFEMEEVVPFTYAVRLPSWCPEAQVLVNGKKAGGEEKDGYLYISRKWENGDRIECTFPMQATYYQADTRVRDDIGKAVLMRGPIVYCVEEADNGKELSLLQVNASYEPQIIDEKWNLAGAEDVVRLRGRGRRILPQEGKLYQPFCGYRYEETDITFIPYYTWCNRGVGEMKVFLPVAGV